MSSEGGYPVAGYGYSGKQKLCARIDLSKASQVDEVNIDDEVTIVVKGKVRRLEGPDKFKSTDYLGNGKEKEVTRVNPGSIELEISSFSVSTDGKFDGLLDMEDS